MPAGASIPALLERMVCAVGTSESIEQLHPSEKDRFFGGEGAGGRKEPRSHATQQQQLAKLPPRFLSHAESGAMTHITSHWLCARALFFRPAGDQSFRSFVSFCAASALLPSAPPPPLLSHGSWPFD